MEVCKYFYWNYYKHWDGPSPPPIIFFLLLFSGSKDILTFPTHLRFVSAKLSPNNFQWGFSRRHCFRNIKLVAQNERKLVPCYYYKTIHLIHPSSGGGGQRGRSAGHLHLLLLRTILLMTILFGIFSGALTHSLVTESTNKMQTIPLAIIVCTDMFPHYIVNDKSKTRDLVDHNLPCLMCGINRAYN